MTDCMGHGAAAALHLRAFDLAHPQGTQGLLAYDRGVIWDRWAFAHPKTEDMTSWPGPCATCDAVLASA